MEKSLIVGMLMLLFLSCEDKHQSKETVFRSKALQDTLSCYLDNQNHLLITFVYLYEDQESKCPRMRLYSAAGAHPIDILLIDPNTQFVSIQIINCHLVSVWSNPIFNWLIEPSQAKLSPRDKRLLRRIKKNEASQYDYIINEKDYCLYNQDSLVVPVLVKTD